MENNAASQVKLAEASCRWLIESAPDGIVIVNSGARIVLVNAQAEHLFGFGADELIGRPVEALIPERFRKNHMGYRSGYMEAPRARPMGMGLDLYGRRRDGSEFPVEISLSPIPTDQGLLVMAIVRDVTEFKREHYISSTLQKSLLSVIPEHVSGLTVAGSYHSAYTGAQVGGDFFDVFCIDDRLTAIAIGDVSGKGVGAAVHTALGKYSLRAYAYVDPEPCRVMERVNTAIHNQIKAESFISMFYGLLDVHAGVLSFANAGHVPPLYLRGSGDDVIELSSGNPPLGVVLGMEFTQHSLEFSGDDRLLLYTDGVTEARDGRGFFGVENLAAFLLSERNAPPQEFVDHLADELEEWSGGHLRDDVAILLVTPE